MYTDEDIANLVARVQQLEERVALNAKAAIPTYGVVSHNLLTRAFSVFGLYLLASLIISLIPACIILVLSLLSPGISNIFNQILTSLQGA